MHTGIIIITVTCMATYTAGIWIADGIAVMRTAKSTFRHAASGIGDTCMATRTDGILIAGGTTITNTAACTIRAVTTTTTATTTSAEATIQQHEQLTTLRQRARVMRAVPS
jgi:hypothetical protein